MKRLILTLCLPLGFGCAQMTQPSGVQSTNNSPQLVNDQRMVAAPGQSNSLYQNNTAVINDSSQVSVPTRKNINHYVRGIMQDMAENLQYVNSKTPLAVSSFIFLDDNYNDGTLLGNQIAESFMHELHSFGVPVIDFKTTDFMRVTPSGDFVFSRDYLELSQDQNFNYVLAGTMVNHQGGVLVNARIIGLASKAVVGSAQGFIPQSVVDALDSSYRTDGVMLKQASK
ncbi:FlgO family outer membrane protein [Pseudoalteromonas prydzensis]|uniref:FlgO family outer membrane protein n=1 Tax=Pseudoalteromonas prydzensis TaxID=182141 RepID=UPI0024BC27D4|nr:FlgO family outer membrane protein [Pseudoalteromonas prydzensis]